MKKRSFLLPWILIAGLSILLIGSTFHKALVTSFTHDESFTYNHYVTASLADIFGYTTVSPNNHLLNTLLMKTVACFFGNSAVALRFPNILAHLGFLVFSLLILRKLKPWIILPLFALLNCNPYLMDFFALARGNGLSYCFLLGSIYFLIRYTDHKKYSLYIWSVVFASFGVLSHFTLLYYLLSLIAVANIYPMIQRFITGDSAASGRRMYIRINLVNLAALLILGIIMAGPVHKLVAADQFFYGGESGFWRNTVGTLIETFFYGIGYGAFWWILMKVLVVTVVISTMVLLTYIILKKKSRLFSENTVLFLVFFLLLFAVFINISQFHILGTKLLVRRYGLLFVPMFMLCLGFLLDFLIREMNIKIIPLFFLYLIASAFTIHTFHSFSGTTYLDWDYEKETRNAMAILEKDVKLHGQPGTISLGITWLFEPTVNFYRDTRGLTWLKPVTRDGPAIEAGYYYIVREDMTRIPLRGASPRILLDDGKVLLVKVK